MSDFYLAVQSVVLVSANFTCEKEKKAEKFSSYALFIANIFLKMNCTVKSCTLPSPLCFVRMKVLK